MNKETLRAIFIVYSADGKIDCQKRPINMIIYYKDKPIYFTIIKFKKYIFFEIGPYDNRIKDRTP